MAELTAEKRLKTVSFSGHSVSSTSSNLSEILPLLGTASDGIEWYLGTAILINALVGAGLLNFPYSLHAAGGIWFSLMVQVVMVALIWSAVTGMVWCSHVKGTALYQETVFEYLGGVGQFICSCCILTYTALLTVNYLTAIGEQISVAARILCRLDDNPWFISKPLLTALLAAFLIFPFCLVRTIDRLVKASEVASAVILVVAVVVVVEFFNTDRSQVHVRTAPDHWTQVFLSLPSYPMAYAYDLCSVAVYGRLKPRTVGSYAKASLTAMGTVFVFYNVIGGFAYATFGDDVNANFMTNYKSKNALIAFAQVAFTAKLCLEYPVYQYLGWTSVRTFTQMFCGKGCEGCLALHHSARVDWFHFAVSSVWVALTAALSMLAPNINYVLPLASSVVIHFQLTFSGLCILQASFSMEDRLSRCQVILIRTVSVCLVAIGIGLSGIMVVQYLYQRQII